MQKGFSENDVMISLVHWHEHQPCWMALIMLIWDRKARLGHRLLKCNTDGGLTCKAHYSQWRNLEG
ncbi:hypothetical protein DsansV1_C24g0180581 [Dioscorea sansibarensis]